jgi:NADP-dependent 3-hydroxy acid dehydrogenase YdfG
MSKLGTKKIFIAARRVNELERVKELCSKKCEIEVIQLDLSDPDKCLDFAENFKD